MATPEGLSAAIDQVIVFFNAKKMDLPDGLFDRKTQFLINGVPFESLLGQSPADPLILMLARGPAGFRFTAKALQHAMPDAHLRRGDVTLDDPLTAKTTLWLTGTLRHTQESIKVAAEVTIGLTAAGVVANASAMIDPATLDKIRQARQS